MKQQLLKRALFFNAGFSLLSGIDFLLFADALASGLGVPAVALRVTGALLVVFALGLLLNARRTPINLKEARIAVASDWLWVAGSALLVALQPIPLTTLGVGVVLGVAAVVAAVVAAFAIAQAAGIRRATA